MPTFSLIIPVYKVEKWLPRCLDSVLAQTYSDYECILIDDGSPDQSGKICDMYAKKDNRFRVIHQANQGVSAARNAGLDLVLGKYIVFCDSDDELRENHLFSLLQCSADLGIVGSSWVGENGNLLREFVFLPSKHLITTATLEMMSENKSLNTVWGKVFSAKIISANAVYFHKDISIGEDTLFVAEYIRCCKTVQFLPEKTYIYFSYEKDRLSTITYEKVLVFEKSLKMMEETLSNFAFSETNAAKRRWISLYLQSSMRIIESNNLNLIRKCIQVRKLLTSERFVQLAKEIELYMPEDTMLVRFLIRNKLISFFVVVQIISRKRHHKN